MIYIEDWHVSIITKCIINLVISTLIVFLYSRELTFAVAIVSYIVLMVIILKRSALLYTYTILLSFATQYVFINGLSEYYAIVVHYNSVAIIAYSYFLAVCKENGDLDKDSRIAIIKILGAIVVFLGVILFAMYMFFAMRTLQLF